MRAWLPSCQCDVESDATPHRAGTPSRCWGESVAGRCIISLFYCISFDCYCFQWIPRANPRGRDALVSPLRAVTESCPPHRTSLLRVLAVLCSPQFCSALLLLHIVCFLVDRSVAVLLVVDCSRRSFRSTTRPACCCRCGLSHAVSHLKSRAAVIEECACVRPLTVPLVSPLLSVLSRQLTSLPRPLPHPRCELETCRARALLVF